MAMFSIRDDGGALLEVETREDGQLHIATWDEGQCAQAILSAEQKRALLKYITEGDDGK